MLLSFLVGYAIGYAIGSILVELCITISDYWHAEQEIRRQAEEQLQRSISVLEVFMKEKGKMCDEEVLEVRAFDKDHNQIAVAKVSAQNGTRLRVGDSF